MPAQPNNSKGYTLVELLVVIIITAIIATMGFSAYRIARDKQEIRSAGETVEGILREAQKASNVGERDCAAPIDGNPLQFYRVTMSGNSITVQAFCQLTSGTPILTTLEDVTFSSGATIEFRTLNGGLVITDPVGVTNTDLKLLSSRSGIEHTITIAQPATIDYKGEVTP